PNQEPANLDGMVTGFFVTSHVPQGFEYSAPRDVLLYGVWQNRMADADFDVPRQRIVLQHYWVGHTPFVLYYQDRQGAIVPYRLANGRLQPLRKGGSPRQKGNRVRTVGNALRRYLKRFETQSEGIFSAAPRLVVIDENIQKPGQIFEEMRATGLKSIMLEPQQ
ncbi:hypothetical protein KY360_04870, partial [Candidatus Woesearchaeota archaeon]|nr:hypothetical protein [Candidatus Woesearchaeota archaeon]